MRNDALQHGIRTSTRTAIIGMGGCVILALVLVCVFLQPGSRVYRCDDFGSYEEMRDAFIRGATYLDADHDGKPCEVRFPNQK